MTQTAERDIKWEVCRNGEALHQRTDNTMEDALNRAVDVIVADLQTKLGIQLDADTESFGQQPGYDCGRGIVIHWMDVAQFNSHRDIGRLAL